MHGRGREGEEGRRLPPNLHMRAVPPLLGALRDSDGSLSSTASSSPSFFFKDGRKISVGDSALFRLLEGSPPSIVTEEKNLTLGVNWLYRPAEVKLGKGTLLDAAPNEIFFSFKKNEILATSLLHPCKVAFLPKGIELPSGISSFVCRRVYDIANRKGRKK
ncbi:hypothetical protein SAY87_008279 [Trapa incisa]|uniref:BAH domain-containing protein n=1 Tax=Trapa incisa TaxID=236973 RepID=A0AAN7QFW8_9MYRT|nr:hypothetical protein SAY87_008279 [Trapa incisa]